MKRTDLPTIAREMRAELAAIPHVERKLDDKFVQLVRRNGRMQLLIGHRDYCPPLEDAQEIARVFGVAEQADLHRGPARIPAPNGYDVRVQAVTFAWSEIA